MIARLSLFNILFATYISYCPFINAQTHTIGGRISNENHVPLPSVNVELLGTTKGAATDSSGVFYINDVVSGNYTLNITAIGYEDYLEELPVDTAKKMEELVNIQFYLDFKLVGEKAKIGKAKEYRMRLAQ